MNAPSARERRRPFDRMRQLRLEPLEDRRLLAADAAPEIMVAPDADGAPWQNPMYALDVNKDESTTASDAVIVINRILAEGVGDLPDPGPDPPEFYFDTSGDNRLTAVDLVRIINGILSPPQVALAPMPPYTADLTPQLVVTATSPGALPDGTLVYLDVDLDNDGDFNDPGETGHTTSTLANQSSSFNITPALPDAAQPYSVKLRARVKDANAVGGSSSVVPLRIDATPSSALTDYVAAADEAYEYHLADAPGITNPIPGANAAGSYFYYVLEMTSQTWRSGDVDLPQWKHWIELYVPITPAGQVIAELDDTSLLFIDGGSNATGVPQSPNPALATGATALKVVVANLKIVPSDPLIFSDEASPRTGNQVLAYSFDKFMDELGQPNNETWPVLLPMVKSAVRAMDSVQDFIPTLKPDALIDDFVVSGFSNQAWATWLTAAADERVSAIVPGVFENLNLAAQMVHHYAGYGFFSNALAAYDNQNVFQRILTAEGAELSRIIDPYQYFSTGRFDNMPKLLINSPGDEYFATDSAQFYFDDIPGNQNYLRYIPNVSHALEFVGDEVAESTLSFLDAILHNRPLPQFSWTVDADQTIHVHTATEPSLVRVRQMNNVNARDFRRLRYPQVFWFDTVLQDQGGGNYVTNVQMPATGARAYFVELTFPNPVPGLPDFVFTTEVRVKTSLPLFPWPFATDVPDDSNDLFSGPATPPPVENHTVAAAVASDSPSSAHSRALLHSEPTEPYAAPDDDTDHDFAVEVIDLALAEWLD